MTPCVLYARCSTRKQEESIDQQREWAVRAAKLHGLTVLREFVDDGIPGDEIALRPGLQQMLAFVEQRATAGDPIGTLLLYDADRLSRANTFRTGAIMVRLIDAGCSRLVTNEGTIDLNEESDALIFNMRQDTARSAYSKLSSGRIANAMLRRAKDGKWNGGPPPYGYRIGKDEKGKATWLLIEPTEAETLRWIFETYADSATSISRLATELSRRGVPVPPRVRSGRWSPWAVWSILRNPHCTGNLYYARRSRGKYNRVRAAGVERLRGVKAPRSRKGDPNDRDAWIVVEDTHPAVISSELFDAVQEKMTAARPDREAGSRPRVREHWPLAGLCRCGDCGGNMTCLKVKVGAKRLTFVRKMSCQTYRDKGREACSQNSVLESEILETVFDVVREQFSDPATLRQLSEALRHDGARQTGAAASERSALRARVAELVGKVRSGTEKLAVVPADLMGDLVEQLRAWKSERERAEVRLRELEDQAAEAAQGEQETATALAAFERLGELVKDAHELPEVRDALHSLVEKVELRFQQREAGSRRFSTCTQLTVHWRPFGEMLPRPSSRPLDDVHGTLRPVTRKLVA